MAKTYRIVRFYFKNGRQRWLDGGFPLEDAQAHCQREDTHASDRVCWRHGKVGQAERCSKCGGMTAPTWFDGYEEE